MTKRDPKLVEPTDAERKESAFLSDAIMRLCGEADSDNAALAALLDCVFRAARKAKMAPAGLMATVLLGFQQEGIWIPALILTTFRNLNEIGALKLPPEVAAFLNRTDG